MARRGSRQPTTYQQTEGNKRLAEGDHIHVERDALTERSLYHGAIDRQEGQIGIIQVHVGITHAGARVIRMAAGIPIWPNVAF